MRGTSLEKWNKLWIEEEKRLADMQMRNVVGAMEGLLVEVRRDLMDTGIHWFCAM